MLTFSIPFFLFLGVGSQFLALATGIMVMAVLGMFNVHRHGAINSAGIVLYAFTSCKWMKFLTLDKESDIIWQSIFSHLWLELYLLILIYVKNIYIILFYNSICELDLICTVNRFCAYEIPLQFAVKIRTYIRICLHDKQHRHIAWLHV